MQRATRSRHMQSTSRESSRKRRSRQPKLGEKTVGWSLTTPAPPLLGLDIPGTRAINASHCTFPDEILSIFLFHSIFLGCVCMKYSVVGWGSEASVPCRESRELMMLKLQMAGVTTLTLIPQAPRRWKLMVCEYVCSFVLFFCFSLSVVVCSRVPLGKYLAEDESRWHGEWSSLPRS